MNKEKKVRDMRMIQKIVAGCIGLCLFACTETDELKTTAGKTGFVVSLTDGSVGVESRKTPAELNVPKTEFTIKVWKAGSDELVASAPCTGETGQVIEVGTGVYDVTAEAGENPLIALDAPYYKGITEDQRVDADKTTNVSIACKVANSLVSVKYDEENLKFSDIYQDGYYVRVAVGGDSEDIKNVENSVYFRAGSAFEVYFCGMKIGETEEKQVKLDVGYTTLNAGNHLILTLSPEPDKYELPLSITKVEVKQETINATIPMEWLPKPKVEAEGFDGNNTLTFVETEQKQAALNLNLSSALQDMKFKFNFQDEQFAALDKEKTYQLSVAEDKAAIETAFGITLPNVGDKPESIDLSNLLAKLQTNAGTPTTNTIEIDVQANNRWSSETKEGEEAPNLKYTLTCNKPEFSIAVQPENCWAWEFSADEVSVTTGNPEKIKNNLVYQYYDGANWVNFNNGYTQRFVKDENRKYVYLTDNPESRIYRVRALYRGEIPSDEVSATLEEPWQLPNSGMEEWYYSAYSSADNMITYYPWSSGKNSYWNTNNEYTTRYRQGTFAYPYNSFPAVSYVPGRNGGKAAELRNTGSGAGNTVDSWFTDDKVDDKNRVAGILFTGDFSCDVGMSAINYSYDRKNGKEFESRPSSLIFWYKYLPYNSDTWQVHVEVWDESKKIITQQSFQSSEKKENYEKVEVKLNYENGVTHKKCKYIYVVFQSTITEGANMPFEWYRSAYTLWKDNEQVTYPEPHIGSILTIDDIELIYN